MADTGRPGGTGGISYPGGRTPVVADPAWPGSSTLILDSVGLTLLTEIVREFLAGHDRTCVVHERNGDSVLSISSCLEGEPQASPGPDRQTLHRQASDQACETGSPADIQCAGGVRVVGVPIHAGAEVAGSITVSEDSARERPSNRSQSTTGTRLLAVARLIGELVRRKRVEAALAQADRRFTHFMAHLPAAVFIRDGDGRYLFANRFLSRMYGLDDCVGKTLPELLPHYIVERVRANDLRALSEGPIMCEECLQDAAGAERFFDSYKFPIDTGDGRILLGGVAVESTERRRAEQALRLSEAFLASLIDQSPYPMWISDSEGVLVRTNRALRELLHVTDEELVGKYNVFEDDIVQEQNLVPVIRRVFDRGEPVRFEIVWDSARLRAIAHRENVSVTLDVSMFPIRNAAGELTNVVIQHVDITERKRAEEALRESERRYRELLENVSVAALMLDPEGTVTFCNDSLSEATGWSRNEIVGRKLADLAAQDLSPDLPRRLLESAARTGGAGSTLEGAIRTRAGKPRWIQWSSTTLRNPAGQVTGFAALGVDVTEHRALQEQYMQAQKLESVGRLAGGVAHDFNNLLTVISGYTNFMLSIAGESDPMRPHLREVLKAADSAASLTSQLLAFSRKQVVQPKLLDLNQLLTANQEMFKRLLGEDIEMVTLPSRDPATVMADPGQMQQVLMNLLVNARDAMPEGGRLTVETAPVRLDSGFAAIHPEAQCGDYILLSVTDTGIGMDAETQQHVFEPFFTTKPKGEGTGLGLPIVYGIVRQSQGWTDVYSEPGQGTAFKIYLPRIAAPIPEEIASPPAVLPAPGERTILVVEDQDQVRTIAVRILRSLGYRVLEADSGTAALTLAGNCPEPIHLLLTDVVMPGMTGKELAERLSLLRPGIKVLYMSGYTENVILQRGVSDPGFEYIGKPFTPATLAARIAGLLQTGSQTEPRAVGEQQ